MSLTEDILTQLPGDVLSGLRQADRLLASMRTDTTAVPTVVTQSETLLETVDWDVVICGGTLGILIGSALVQRGWRVALLERGILRGRQQEWNISRQELSVFLRLNLLTEAELEQAIATEYNPARVSFHNSGENWGGEIWVKDVLNLGVNPIYLLETLKQKFLAAGGVLLENTPFVSAIVHPNGVLVETGAGSASVQEAGEKKAEEQLPITNYQLPITNYQLPITTRLLIDAMGHLSPMTQQARQGQKPDSICLVVGSCAQGFPQNQTGDLIATFTPIQNRCQYFWEAFPARDGRTTYLFTYMDASPDHLGLEALFEEYLRLLPQYQAVNLDKLHFQRALFGFFPAYRQSPLRTPWNRILPVGDSSGNQSPLSFGGFGAMVRHLERLTLGIHAALSSEQLSASSLSLLAPYQPNLSVTWLFQKAMRADVRETIPPDRINRLLAVVFLTMQQLGDRVLRPFLQDVVQFLPLTQTLFKTAIAHPLLIAQIIPHVGLGALIDWTIHYTNLGIYSVLSKFSPIIQPWLKNLPTPQQYKYHRWIDAWRYGSGED
ncbi:FAD-dependent oxidoreductase [Chroococcidiopsis sp. CCNUC1]|uniref:FAD-dependent oxidoreductase n=1 Tax=Chroococcidiopsis sp. CCNUC1 TaxID=2653189 RepID=UPI000D04C932|nr:FAD-dependent oxidoreductase [Chroococcidiopsis sp. CCNUC1]PSB42116.1 FAD-dependent oxidoreductase [Cyanosarcina cf. burmensis CCALA 770]URD50492.1 FAD-binding oxidoreductase [Chroococcidiopsis sp. CCNUC1]